MADFKETVLLKLRYTDVYSKVEKQKSGTGDWINGLCPFHEDTTRSFSFDARSLAWKCHGGCGGGDAFNFVMKQLGLDFKQALAYLAELVGVERAKKKKPRPPIPETLIEELHKKLPPEARKYLNDRSISDSAIKKFQLGWDEVRKRISIPVRDENGNLVNVRYYSWTQKLKMFNHIVKIKKDGETEEHRYGSPARLFNLAELAETKKRQVYLVEGEFDCMLLRQESGAVVVTGTHGAPTFPSGWAKYFDNKDVVIIYDCDHAGKSAANKNVIPALKHKARSIKNVVLPLKGTKSDKDISDWFVKRGKSWEELKAVIDETPEWEEPPDENEEIIDLDSFVWIESKKYVDKKIRCEITVCGETEESFHAVEEFIVESCTKREKGDCCECPTDTPLVLEHGAREYIGSCMSTDVQVIQALRSYCCKLNQRPGIKVVKRTTIKEFFCHQKLVRTTSTDTGVNEDDLIDNGLNQELIEKRVYYMSSKDVKPGPYLAVGWVKTHPKTQHVTFLIESLEPQEEDFQAFKLKDSIPLLKAYRKLSIPEVLEDLTEHVTRIYQRQELLLAALLTLASPRWLPFNGEIIRGWLFVVVMGDSGQGKSLVFNSISTYAGVGDIVSALTSSRTGLAYALVEHKQKGWQVKIGRYPANNGKLLTVDEAQHLPEFDLRCLSIAIEKGFMQIDRVQSKGFDCQTRLLLLCNPKNDNIMDSQTFGCETLKGVFPPPIIRRLDFAVFVNTSDLSDNLEFINKRKDPNSKPKISPEMLRAVIYWVWNLRPQDIEFHADAEKRCLSEAGRLGKIFGFATDIPLVSPADFRHALARISAAFAGLDMSASDDFRKMHVLERHVVMAVGMIEKIYTHEIAALMSIQQ